MGKGTAIKGKSDIDLVLVLNEVKDAKDLKEKLPSIKQKIINMLEGNAGKFNNFTEDNIDDTFPREVYRKRHAWKYRR